MKKAIKIILTSLAIITFLILGALTYGYFYVKDCLQGYPTGNDIEVTIPQGASGADAGEILKEKGIIRDSIVFRFAMKQYLKSGRILPGTYTFNPKESMSEIIEKLEKGSISLNLVTIPEGLTIKEIAEIFSKKGLCSKDEFMEAIKTNKFTVNGEELKDVEGFLLPNTYDIPKEYTPFQIAEMMIKSFDKKITPIYLEKKGKLPVDLTLKEIVTLASLVEREASVPEERPIIAGVYYNRLKIGMKLECDATIQYALGHQKKELLYSDLEIDSPYNTYKYEGLPPGPIANPGEESLKAVLNPSQHNYYFYVLNGIKNNGTHVFSETAREHENAVNKYLR